MEKLNTIQKINNLNGVFRIGEKGPGGAHHDYLVIMNGTNQKDTLAKATTIEFQKGARTAELARHGVLDNDLLEIVRDRLIAFQKGDFACHENEMALIHIEEALLWMNKRVEDRAERNVLGTYNK